MSTGWRVAPLAELVDRIAGLRHDHGPVLVALNGHGSSGKTTLARRLAQTLPATAVVHTDDLAWNQGVFSWDRLLRDDVLPAVRAGEPLDYRPPAWRAGGREDSLTLPGGLGCLIVEGVGASQPSLRDLYDFVVWVETEAPTRWARDETRLAGGENTPSGFTRWMAEENAYVTAEHPWLDADLVVYGGDWIGWDAETEVVLGPPSPAATR